MNVLHSDIADALHNADAKSGKNEPEYFACSGDRAYPLVLCTTKGFSVAREDGPRLSGFVDIMKGNEYIARGLVVLAQEIGGLLHYEFKRRTENTATPPVDYEISETAPVGLLT